MSGLIHHQALTTFLAAGPLSVSSISNETRSPSDSVLNPDMLIAE